MFYKIVFWLFVALFVVFCIGSVFMMLLACGMSDAPVNSLGECFGHFL